MSDKVAELKSVFPDDETGQWVANLWDTYNKQRSPVMSRWLELDNYLFATDTSTTSNSTLPWKNSTTLPKLTQIRDNLHSNYISALFPNDKWLTWKGYTKKDSSRKKAKIITAYMENKTRESKYRQEVSKLVYDYISRGNAFVTCSFEKRYNTSKTGEKVPGFIGPRAHRIAAEDIVFNPLANSFDDTWKIIRTVKTLGELQKLSETEPGYAFWGDVVKKRVEQHRKIFGNYGVDDFNKAERMSIDGFGNLYEYYMSDSVEILEFYGDYFDINTGTLQTDRMITVVDRCYKVRNEPIDTLSGRAPIRHVGWRLRPDNLWAMGPLENLVGMQYRIDHLENLKADAMDLTVHPPLVIIGEVEEFIWGPGVEIHLDEGGSITELTKSMNAIITATNQISELEDKMELYAGAPREAMGVRTPGEKTATEVNGLFTAAARIFQEKTTNFEINLMEPNLNDQLEISVRNFDGSDVIRTMDNSLGVTEFATITVGDITASGVLRPVGARHFGQTAQEVQNLLGIANSPLWELVRPHTSGIAMTQFIDDVTNLAGYNIFRSNVAVEEAKETQSLMNQGGEDLMTEASMPAPTNTLPPEEIPA